MNIDEYQQYALKSIALPKGSVDALAHRSLGLAGEAGITANQVKRIIRDQNGKATASDIQAIEERLGDVMFYAATLAEYFDLKLSDVLKANMKKSDTFRHTRTDNS